MSSLPSPVEQLKVRGKPVQEARYISKMLNKTDAIATMNEFGLVWKNMSGEEIIQYFSPPMESIPDPYPTLNWEQVRSQTPKSLPQPEGFPVLGPPTKECFDGILRNYLNNNGMQCQDYDFWYGRSYPNGVTHQNFQLGWKSGFMTSQGIVKPPDYPIRGYIWNEGWVLHAEFG